MVHTLSKSCLTVTPMTLIKEFLKRVKLGKKHEKSDNILVLNKASCWLNLKYLEEETKAIILIPIVSWVSLMTNFMGQLIFCSHCLHTVFLCNVGVLHFCSITLSLLTLILPSKL